MKGATGRLKVDFNYVWKQVIRAFCYVVTGVTVYLLCPTPDFKHADPAASILVHCMNPDGTAATGTHLVLSDLSSRFTDGYGYLCVPSSFRDEWADFYNKNRVLVGRHQLRVDERDQCEIQIQPAPRKRKP